jgi:hypothetical protein
MVNDRRPNIANNIRQCAKALLNGLPTLRERASRDHADSNSKRVSSIRHHQIIVQAQLTR